MSSAANASSRMLVRRATRRRSTWVSSHCFSPQVAPNVTVVSETALVVGTDGRQPTTVTLERVYVKYDLTGVRVRGRRGDGRCGALRTIRDVRINPYALAVLDAAMPALSVEGAAMACAPPLIMLLPVSGQVHESTRLMRPCDQVLNKAVKRAPLGRP